MITIEPGIVLENLNTGKRVRIAEVGLPVDSITVHWGDSLTDPVSLPIRRGLFTDTAYWKVIEPYVCGSCGLRFYEETPAGRCPNEGDHEADLPDEYTWNLYSLSDGIADDDQGFDDFADACIAFAALVSHYAKLSAAGELTADVTVHLYHGGWGVMEAERHVSAVQS